MHNAYHQGQYSKVAEFDTSALCAENALPARILILRARVAQGQAEEVMAELEGEEDVPDLAAVKAFAQFTADDVSSATKMIEKLVSESQENKTVQLLGATVLQAEGRSEEALALLGNNQGDIEAYGHRSKEKHPGRKSC